MLCFGLGAILGNGCLGTAIIAVCVFLYFLCPMPCFGVAVTGLVFARKAKSGRLTTLGITELILFAGWIALAVYSFIGGMSV